MQCILSLLALSLNADQAGSPGTSCWFWSGLTNMQTLKSTIICKICVLTNSRSNHILFSCCCFLSRKDTLWLLCRHRDILWKKMTMIISMCTMMVFLWSIFHTNASRHVKLMITLVTFELLHDFTLQIQLCTLHPPGQKWKVCPLFFFPISYCIGHIIMFSNFKDTIKDIFRLIIVLVSFRFS